MKSKNIIVANFKFDGTFSGAGGVSGEYRVLSLSALLVLQYDKNSSLLTGEDQTSSFLTGTRLTEYSLEPLIT